MFCDIVSSKRIFPSESLFSSSLILFQTLHAHIRTDTYTHIHPCTRVCVYVCVWVKRTDKQAHRTFFLSFSYLQTTECNFTLNKCKKYAKDSGFQSIFSYVLSYFQEWENLILWIFDKLIFIVLSHTNNDGNWLFQFLFLNELALATKISIKMM